MMGQQQHGCVISLVLQIQVPYHVVRQGQQQTFLLVYLVVEALHVLQVQQREQMFR